MGTFKCGVFIMVSRIIILSAAVFLIAQAFSIDPFKIDKRWERFKKAYNKTYPSDSEEARRHAIWKNNTVLIMEHNKLFHANKTTFRLGMNSNADMTAKEFAARFNGFRKKHPNSHGPWNPSHQADVRDLPVSVDWVNKGYVTPIKNQQQCGSCWLSQPLAPWREPTLRQRGSWCLSPSRTWLTAASPRGIWAVREVLWTRLSTTRLSTRVLTPKLPTNTRQWTERASTMLPMSGPPSSLGPMSVQAVSQICKRQLQQWDQ